MAYRRSNGKGRSRKIEPAVKTLTFTLAVPPQVDGVPGEIDGFIDLSQCACLVNRRFYRQGLNWAVASVKILSTPAGAGNLDGSVSLTKLPETWVMSNAWTKGFHSWKDMNDEALDESESVRPRFLDFKVFMDSDHHAVGYVGNMLPVSETGVPATPGEWESSKLLIPLTGPSATDPGQVTEREILAVGANYPGNSPVSGLNAVSLIEGYAASRALPDVLDPNVPADADDADGGTPENWMAALDNEGTQQTDETLGVLTSENNIAPYPFENDGASVDTMYPNGANQLAGLEIHDFELITGTTIGGTTRLKGGVFPCGLLKLFCRNFDSAATNHTITVDLVPGPHRGYLAESMLEA